MHGEWPDDDPRDAALDVPLEPVAAEDGGRRRAGVVLAAAVAVVAVGVALAAVPKEAGPSTADSPAQGVARPAAVASASGQRPSQSNPGPQPSSRRQETLLALSNKPLAGAPNPVLVERHGNDARLLAWDPGEPLRTIRTFSNAFTGEAQYPVLSPDAASLVIATVHSDSAEAVDTARLLTGNGRVAWEGDGIMSVRGIIWSIDSRKVVLDGAPGTWWVVAIDAEGRAKSQRIVLDDGTEADPTSAPAVRPSATPSAARLELAPVGFSVDGRWVYGAAVSTAGGTLAPSVRVSIPAGTIESISGYPSSGPARLATDGGFRGIDPTSGRAIRWGPNASTPGGPPTLEVTEADGSLAYRVETDVVLGTAWEATGDLLILEADGYPFPKKLRLLQVAPDGTVGPPVLSTESVAWGGLLGARDGFAVLALATQRPTDGSQLVVIDLADGKAAGLTLPIDQMDILGASILP
jgi:hypothetical protein